MEQLNTLIKSTLKKRHSTSPEYYIDFLNIACLLGGVRNGIHLDNITSRTLMRRIMNNLSHFKSFDSNTRFETTIWNTEKITMGQLLNSWAFLGDSNKKEDSTYWANNSILLGNEKGYPTYSADNTNMNIWSLELTLHYDGQSYYPISMMGGIYDKEKPDDLQSIQQIQTFLEGFVGQEMYSPSGIPVFLEEVKLKID
jgi:hypothetical protein